MTRNGLTAVACSTAAAALLAGCDLAALTADQTAGMLYKATPALESEEDPGLAEAAIVANLKLFEALMTVSPKNRKVYYLSAQAFGSYAFGFLDPRIESISDPYDPIKRTLVARAISCYRRGRTYGEKWMAFKVKDIEKKLHGDRATALDAIAKLDKKMVPGLFWAGYNWAQLINLRVDLVEDKPVATDASDEGEIGTAPPPATSGEGLAEGEIEVAKAMMMRVIDLEAGYFNAGAHGVMGVMEGVIPAALGGRAEKSLEHFDKAIALTGGKFLLHKVFKAQFWATNAGDRAAFEALLKEVLAAPDDLYPAQRLTNELAKLRAAALLKQIDTLFVTAG